MGLNLPIAGILVYAAALVGLYLLGRFLAMPLKWLLRLVGNVLLGGVAIFIINAIGSGLGFCIGINPLTMAVVGILGIPGAALLIILKLIL